MPNDYVQYTNYRPPAAPSYGMQAPTLPDPASTVMPELSAGLQGVGLLANLYGAYQQREAQDQNYQLQKQQFEREKRLQDEQIAREKAAKLQQDQFNAGTYAQNKDQNSLAAYLPYLRSIGA